MSPLLITICLVMTVSLVCGNNLQQLTSASNTFAQNLYQEIDENEENIIFTLSVHVILTVASRGARGRTRAEMLKVLGLNNFTGNSSQEGYQELIKQWENDTDVELSLANGLFLNPKKEIEPGFKDDASKYYSAQVSSFDFSAPGGPEKVINDFVKQSTNGKIQDILDPGTISADTELVAVSALFFKGAWAKKFSKQDTKKRNFTKLDGTIIQVDTLYDERTVNIKRNVYGSDVVELDFTGHRFSLYIILPRKVDGITNLEKSFKNPGRLDSFFTGLSPERVKIYVPKFNITSKFSVKSALVKLGMVKAFQPRVAEFQGMVKAFQPRVAEFQGMVKAFQPRVAEFQSTANGISIRDLIFQTAVTVDEEGINAEASTTFELEAVSLPSPAKFTIRFSRPFMLLILDNKNKQIMFVGKVSG